jgi:hypothetical protein
VERGLRKLVDRGLLLIIRKDIRKITNEELGRRLEVGYWRLEDRKEDG